MKHNSMSDALRNKRAHGLDIAIIIGGADSVNSTRKPDSQEMSDKKQQESGLAPDAEPLEGEIKEGEMGANHPDEMQDKMLIEQALAKAGLGKSSLAHRALTKGK